MDDPPDQVLGVVRGAVDEPLGGQALEEGDAGGEALGVAHLECGQAIAVRHGAEHGEYLHTMYLDHFGPPPPVGS
ncbi:hypothetical protein [Streptomyces sp. NPDC093097]|uniref:hypothetical protein n=1 Tax=Streptomyces sp. NPDC093097 TaxID=3366027 RepID=UPI003810DC17